MPLQPGKGSTSISVREVEIGLQTGEAGEESCGSEQQLHKKLKSHECWGKLVCIMNCLQVKPRHLMLNLHNNLYTS